MTDANEHTIVTLETVTSEKATPANLPENSTTPEKEYGGPKGLEPTRYGDWEKAGRCIDF